MRTKFRSVASCAIMLVMLFGLVAFGIGGRSGKIDVQAAGYDDGQIQNGAIYKIQNVITGYSMDVDCSKGGKDNGTQIIQWSSHEGANQQFQLNFKDSVWEIVPMHTTSLGSSIDVAWGSSENNAVVHLWERNNTNAQRFELRKNPNGTYRIYTKVTNYSMVLAPQSTAQSCRIVQTTNTVLADWRLIKVHEQTHKGQAFGYYDLPDAPTSSAFGKPILAEEFEVEGSYNTKWHAWLNNSIYTKMPKYKVRIWEYPTALDTSDGKELAKVRMQPNDLFVYTYTETTTQTVLYSETISLGLEFTQKFSESHEIGIPKSNLTVNYSSETTIKSRVETTFTYTNSTTFTKGHTISLQPIRTDETGTVEYRVERRVTMKYFYVQVFEYIYDVEKVITKKSTWYAPYAEEREYRHTLNHFVCREELNNWKVVGSPALALTPYKWDAAAGNYVYAGVREPGLIHV